MKKDLLFLFIFGFSMISAQKKFQIIYQNNDYSTSYIADKNKKVIKKLDDSYILNYRPETLGYFSIFAMREDSGWVAVDIDGNKLFKVLNTEVGTPSPDDIVENRIRIVDEQERIGFADEKGKIIIQPQFEMVTTFHNGKAIIGEKCKQVPWDMHPGENDCKHYSVECEKYGYINSKGKVIELGTHTFDEIVKKINWKLE